MKADAFLEVVREFKHSEISIALAAALLAIRNGADRPGKLARDLGVCDASVSGYLRDGRKRGLITRSMSEVDLREVEISLTDKAKEWLAATFPE